MPQPTPSNTPKITEKIILREYVVRTRKVGDAVFIELPKELLKAEQISADAAVKITVQKYQSPAVGRVKADHSLGPDDPWKLLE